MFPGVQQNAGDEILPPIVFLWRYFTFIWELVCKMYFTHSPPLSLCWYDRLLYELWIHDLCLNPSTSPDIFYAETSRHSPPPGHAATWRGVTSRVTAVTQPAVMSCLDRVTMLHHQTMSHSRTLQRFILETLKTILTQHSWWTVWLCSYCY